MNGELEFKTLGFGEFYLLWGICPKNSHAFWLCLRNVVVGMGVHKHYHLLDSIHVKHIEIYKPASRSLDATLLVEHYFVLGPLIP